MSRIEDSGLLLSELTVPYSNGSEFYKKNVKPLFDNYKANMAKSGVVFSPSDAKLFYNPAAYCSLGNYDLAILSLIEDFHFGNRHFHPYSFLNSDYKNSTGFNYHLTTASSAASNRGYLIDKAKKTFLRTTNRYPFIGISNFKVKNSLLIGTGHSVVSMAVAAIKKLLNEYKKLYPPFDFLIYEPISWNEIGVIYFSNNFKTIADALLVSREINVSYALTAFKQFDKIDLREELVEKSLMSKLISPKNKSRQILDSHLFTHTYSNLAIDIKWLEGYRVLNNQVNEPLYMKGFMPAKISQEFNGFMRWFVKPYHLQKFLKSDEFKQSGTEGSQCGDFNLIIGNGDVEELHSDGASLKELLNRLKRFHVDAVVSSKQRFSSVRKTKTIPKLSYKIEEVHRLLSLFKLESNNLASESVSKKLRKYAFKVKEIKEIRDQLVKIKVTKTLRERILNAFINYNDGIEDPILYAGFIELRDYLKFIAQYIKNEVKLVKDDTKAHDVDAFTRHTRYNQFIEDFFSAYETLLAHSHRLYGVTDFNLDYNGGIQPIISGYDAVFKFIRKQINFEQLNKKRKLQPNICVISGMPVIKSTGNSIRINYNHLFNPEFFLAALNKEAMNHYYKMKALKQVQAYRIQDRQALKMAAYYYRSDDIESGKALIKSLDKQRVNLSEVCIYLIEHAFGNLVGEFKRNLLDKIRDNPDKRSKILMLEYLETVNAGSFLYLLEDGFSAHVIGFDTHLEWMWNIYVQESDAYNYNLTFNETKLFRILLRTAAIVKRENVSFNLERFCKKLSKDQEAQVLYHWHSIKEFTNLLMDLELIPDLKSEDLINYGRTSFDNLGLVYDLNPGNGTFDVLAAFDKENSFKECLRKGDIAGLKIEDFSSLVKLITAYLHEINKLLPKKNIVLVRRVDDGQQDFNKGKYFHPEIQNNLLLDPTGGAYTIGCEVRRKYFKLRQTVIKALYDFSLRQKIQLFN